MRYPSKGKVVGSIPAEALPLFLFFIFTLTTAPLLKIFYVYLFPPYDFLDLYLHFLFMFFFSSIYLFYISIFFLFFFVFCRLILLFLYFISQARMAEWSKAAV